MKYFKKLVGERVYLSPVNIEDAEKYTKWLNDFNITDYIGRSGKVITLEEEKQWFQNMNDQKIVFAIVKLENDELIGNTGIHDIDYINRTATLGIFIGEKENWNKGYGTEVFNMLLDYSFNYLNLNNIKLDVMEFNPRAIACYKKSGFKEIGRRRKSKFINGKYYDTISMDILAEEFKQEAIRNKNI